MIGNMLDYIDWRGDLSFRQSPLCEVDHLILSELSYLPLDGIVPAGFTACIPFGSAVNRFLTQNAGNKISFGAIIPDEILLLAEKARDSRRFGSLTVTGYRNHIDTAVEQQFSAITFLYENEFAYCSFRGTDDTIIGWKEDLNLSFLEELPSQKKAAEYVSLAEEMLEVPHFYFGGHSKGGNLAIYAAVRGSDAVKEKLVSAFGGDSPGFCEAFAAREDYQAAAGKLLHFVPTSSVVGMLMEQGSSIVVESVNSGINQHDGFSWRVLGDHFIHAEELNREAKKTAAVMRQWIGEMSMEERERFSGILYDIFSAGGQKDTLTALTADKPALLKSFGRLDAESKRSVLRWLKQLHDVRRKEN